MKERPIGHLVDALRQGGKIDYLEQTDIRRYVFVGIFGREC